MKRNDIKTILLIDDSKGVRQFLIPALKSLDLEVVGEAANGTEGLELYEKFKPDLVFLDLVMPAMSGIEVLKKIKQMDPDAIIVILTSAADKDSVIESKNEGATDYLLKPFDLKRIKRTINKIKANLAEVENTKND
ncbi:response regulator [Candidatus Poribacteria bacterium]|nr:response regulator [Candidatus Poribacteria bacterium]